MIKISSILMRGITISTRLVFYQNFSDMFLSLKYLIVFVGLFFHKFETSYHKKVYTMLSINKALNPLAPTEWVTIPTYLQTAISRK